MANRSTFPEQVDQFVELFDLPPLQVANARRYQELKIKPSLSAMEQTELNNLTEQLGDYIITPETWNKFADSLMNMQVFIKDEVEGYIGDKQTLWDAYIRSFKHVGNYSSSTQYLFQNMVTYNGDLYLCKKEGAPIGTAPTNTTYWTKISTKGDKGDVGLNAYYKGDYSATTAYVVGDAVTYEGNTYYNKLASTGVAPSNPTNWTLFDSIVVSQTAPAGAQKGQIWIEVE